MHEFTHLCAHTHTHTHIHVHTHHTRTHTDWACITCNDFGFLFLTLFSQSIHVHKCTHLCARACTRAHTHTHTHIHTHTHTQLYTASCMQGVKLVFMVYSNGWTLSTKWYVMCTYCETFNSSAYNHKYSCIVPLSLHVYCDEFYCTYAISTDCGRSCRASGKN